MRFDFTRYHLSLGALFCMYIVVWTFGILPKISQYFALSAATVQWLTLFSNAALVVLLCYLLNRYEAYRNRYAFQPGAIEHTGLLWSTTFLPDGICDFHFYGEVYYRFDEIQQVRIWGGSGSGQRGYSLCLAKHQSKWSRPELEIHFPISAIDWETNQEIARFILDHTPNAHHSDEFLAVVETGTW